LAHLAQSSLFHSALLFPLNLKCSEPIFLAFSLMLLSGIRILTLLRLNKRFEAIFARLVFLKVSFALNIFNLKSNLIPFTKKEIE